MTSCVDTLGPGPPPNILCQSNHCDEFQETTVYHRICNCIDWQGNPIQNCSAKDNLYPVQTAQCYNPNTNTYQDVTSQQCTALGAPWFFQTCYCCCSCFAAYTPVANPDGMRAIGDYVIGDLVLAASAGPNGAWTWAPQTVNFSSGSPPATGTGPTAGNIMVYIEYGNSQALIASSNQLFVMRDGKLKRADQLVPGTDSLVDPDGGSVAIHRLASGHYKGAIHHIATAVPDYADWDGSIDEHLINANGIIVGDYLLQMYQTTPKMAPNLEAADAPSLGTADYKAATSTLVTKPFSVGKSLEVVGTEVTVPGFRAHQESAAYVPDDALRLFSAEQEAYLMDPDIPKRGFSDKTNVQMTEYYMTLYGGFYPNVSIYLDWESIHPNVYAFNQYGRATVVICGEFLRLGPLYGQAMAMALSFGVAGAGFPADAGNLGQSIYDGIGAVMQAALQGGDTYMSTCRAGQAQLDALLGMLAAKDDEGGDGALSPSCISDVIDAAVSGDLLPPCAGGPPSATLEVQSASYGADGLRVTFSEPVDTDSATKVGNYRIRPAGAISGASMVSGNPATVMLAVHLPPGDGSVLVQGVKGSSGATLDPRHVSAKFTVPPS